jgi:hypothetical protein
MIVAGIDPSYDRILAAYRGDLQVRINEVIHGHDGKAGLPRTRCGIRWIAGVIVPQTFPRGVPTEDAVDCMTCLVLEARS